MTCGAARGEALRRPGSDDGLFRSEPDLDKLLAVWGGNVLLGAAGLAGFPALGEAARRPGAGRSGAAGRAGEGAGGRSREAGRGDGPAALPLTRAPSAT
ncbi:hypothetical protein OG342_33685 [Streptomyces bobili]|uniref:hypothetical protein n=1 Tax=Streptomyces bobili TaxID=67280 RepID=UPI002253FCCA|nr:hypothetical protein [Streptomyces bobili]MCX5527750.1 hypothetical protein [Streptomyces bobili]